MPSPFAAPSPGLKSFVLAYYRMHREEPDASDEYDSGHAADPMEAEGDNWSGPVHVEWLDRAMTLLAAAGAGHLFAAPPPPPCPCGSDRAGVAVEAGQRARLLRKSAPRVVEGEVLRSKERCPACLRRIWRVRGADGVRYLGSGRNMVVTSPAPGASPLPPGPDPAARPPACPAEVDGEAVDEPDAIGA